MNHLCGRENLDNTLKLSLRRYDIFSFNYIINSIVLVVEKGEGKSTVYRFCLHDDVYAFINTRSKLFHNPTTGKTDSILSTHTIVR
jgi:hypothetical protein